MSAFEYYDWDGFIETRLIDDSGVVWYSPGYVPEIFHNGRMRPRMLYDVPELNRKFYSALGYKGPLAQDWEYYEGGAAMTDELESFIKSRGYVYLQTSGGGLDRGQYFDKDGNPVGIQLRVASTNMAMGLGLMLLAVPGLNAVIGSLVLGTETAAAYPVLANAVGNAAVSTALNGGDVAAGVKSAALGYVGGVAGGFAKDAVSVATGSDLIGKAADVTVSSLVKGSNPAYALVGSVAPSIVEKMVGAPSEVSLSTGANMDLFYSDTDPTLFEGDPFGANAADDSFGDPYSVQTLGADGGDFVLSDIEFDSDLSSMYHDPVYDPSGGQGASISTGIGTDYGTASGGSSSGWSALAQVVIAGIQAWTAANKPAARFGVQRTASGGYATPNANGTLTVRSATGQVSQQQMPVGTPYVLADGRTVINNGNGTYSTISTSGAVSTGQYSSSGMFGNIPPAVLYGGLGLLAVLALRR